MTDEIEIAMRKIEHAGAYCSWDTPGTHLDSHKGSSTTEKGTNQAIHLGDELASSLGSGAPHGMMFPLQASPPGLQYVLMCPRLEYRLCHCGTLMWSPRGL